MHVRFGWQRVVVAAAAISGVLALTAPATAQLKPGEINSYIVQELSFNDICITHLRRMESAADGNTTYPVAWVGGQCGVTMYYLESGRDVTSLHLARTDRKKTLDFNISSRTVAVKEETAPGSSRSFSQPITRVSAEACRWDKSAGNQPCTCDLRDLKPLQGAAGAGEVAKKTSDIEDPAELENEKIDLRGDPIKVVLGPAHQLFVTDHHHGAAAWIKAGYQMGVCVIQHDRSGDRPDQFYEYLKGQKLVRLVDAGGNAIAADNLPKTVADLPDDPYRTLAWMVRRDNGFCRKLMSQPPPEFAEFQWADAMRKKKKKLPLDDVRSATAPGLWQLKQGETPDQLKDRRKNAQKKVLREAVAFATSAEAAALPGYQGTQGLKGSECNP